MTVFRHDIRSDRKGIHFQISKTTHAGLRAQLFKHNISMQEAFNEFARLVVAEDRTALRVVEGIAKRKLMGQLEEIKRLHFERPPDDLDKESLYHLIDVETMTAGEK